MERKTVARDHRFSRYPPPTNTVASLVRRTYVVCIHYVLYERVHANSVLVRTRRRRSFQIYYNVHYGPADDVRSRSGIVARGKRRGGEGMAGNNRIMITRLSAQCMCTITRTF